MSIADLAFEELMRIAGRQPPDFVEIKDETPALRTRFYAGEGAAAVIAAGATMAADIWETRTGQSQTVHVGTREASASLGSMIHQTFHNDDLAPASSLSGRHTFGGFYATRDDRHVFLHQSFPESGQRLLNVLGCDDDPGSVASAVRRWDAQDLEDAIANARACAGIVRTPEEWDSSEQGRILNGLPCVEVVKIADSSPEPFPKAGDMPLSGIRVLDLTRVLAGPTCARTLAQYGADAMRIGSENLPSVSRFVTDTGHGKLSAFIDLKTEVGKECLRTLIVQSDVFSQGYRTGALERLGLGVADLSRLRPGIIYTSINCYGHEGPWRHRAGWEQLAQTVSGMAHIQGGKEGPQLIPAAVTDYTTGFLAAFGSLVALKRRALYGGSYLVRVSLSQTGMWLRSLGLAGDEVLDTAEAFADEEIKSFSITSDTGFGPITHLRPPVHLSATPARWKRGVVPLGTHQPVWLD
ncbi:MAG: CoA transferase [Desulfobacterales bacterium]